MKKIIRILPIQPSVQQVTLDFERAVWKALRSARGEHVKGRGGLPSFSLLMRPRHFFFRPSSPPPNKTKQQQQQQQKTGACYAGYDWPYSGTFLRGDWRGRAIHWFFYNEFEDAQEQAPTKVQWHDAELTVKWHLTDRLLSPMRTYCVLGYLLLEPHWSPTQRSIFARCIATQKQAELY